MPNYQRFGLGALYAQFDEVARGRDKHGDSAALHAAILERLAAHRRAAGGRLDVAHARARRRDGTAPHRRPGAGHGRSHGGSRHGTGGARLTTC
jgi:hypothetical protein